MIYRENMVNIASDLVDVPNGVNLKVYDIDGILSFDVSVDHEWRDQGVARLVLTDLCMAADELGMAMAIVANPDDSDWMPMSDLMRFYKSLGFAPVGYHGYMARPSGSATRS